MPVHPDGVLARLHRQAEEPEAAEVGDEERLDVGDHQHLDVGDAHRPESPVQPPLPPTATSPPESPHEHHHEHQDRGAVPWSAPPTSSLFADYLEPGTTAGSLFNDPEEFYR